MRVGLRAGHVVLRPFVHDDADAFVAAVLESVDSVSPWLPWCHAQYSRAEALRWFAFAEAQALAGSAYEFGVFDAMDARLLGGAGLNEIDAQRKSANIGYWVRRSAQRQGVALACMQALRRCAFEQLRLQRAEIVAAVGNDASAGVARKAGARYEGITPARLTIRETAHDAHIFAFTHTEPRTQP